MTSIRTYAFATIAALGLILTVGSVPSSASEEDGRRACEPQAFAYCSSEFPDVARVTQCLKKNPKVSKLCKDYVNGVRK